MSTVRREHRPPAATARREHQPAAGAAAPVRRSGGIQVAVLALVAALPLLATAGRAGTDWRPVGDTAAITLRSLDVFTSHSPLVGMPTTLSDTVGQILHHPGPIEFWAIAVTQIVVHHHVAPMVAVVVVNLAAVVAIVVVAGWIGGSHGRLLAALLVALCTWSLRGDYLIDPYNPYAAWLPLATFAVSLAAAVGGRLWALPVTVVAGSYAAQSHVSLVVPVGMACLTALVVAGVDAWSADRSPSGAVGRVRRSIATQGRPLAVAGMVAVVCWSPVLIDMIAGRQNLFTLVGATGADGPVLGSSRAWQVLARAVTSPPWVVADRDPFATVAPVPGIQQVAAVLVLAAAIALAAAGWRRRRGGAALLVVAVAGLVGGMIAASRIPGGIFAAYALHNYLWLWPFTAALWAGIIGSAHIVLVGRWERSPGSLPAWVVPAALGVALAAVAAMGTFQEPVRASVLAGRHGPAVGDLGAQLGGSLDRSRPVVLDIEAELDQSAVAMGLVLELERRGFHAQVDADLGGSFGTHRVVAAGEPADRLFTRVGRVGPPELPPAAEVVAVHQPTTALLSRLDAANGEVLDLIDAAGGLILATEVGAIESTRATELVQRGDLVGLGRLDLILQPEIPDDVFTRYAAAQEGPILFVTVYRLATG